MNILATAIFFGWIPIILGIFACLPARKAAITSAVAGWLLVPSVRVSLPGIPDYSKVTASMLGILLGTAIFDAARLARLRPRWADLPMLAWCACPMASSQLNDLGPYDGMAESLNYIFIWGIPYLLGRAYFGDLDGLRALAVGIVAGGLFYVPPCLLEIRLSPQIQATVYGMGHFEGVRFGGYRPFVFMTTGLELGMYMTAASLLGVWLWAAGGVKRLGGRRFGPLLALLVATTVLCKSTGALIELALGLAALGAATLGGRGRAWVLWALVAIAPAYMASRSLGLWSGVEAVQVAGTLINAERAQSLEFRLDNEDVLIRKALERGIFGWGGWNRSMAFCPKYQIMSVTDGLWIITFGRNGLFGLAALTATYLMPLVVLMRRFPPRRWREPGLAAPMALGVLAVLAMIDNLSNGMLNPLYTLAAGGLMGLSSGDRGGRAGAATAVAAMQATPAPGPAVDAATEATALRCEQLAASGRPEDAERGLRLLAAHLAGSEGRPARLRDLAATHERLARLMGAQGRRGEAEAAWREALRLRRDLAEQAPDDPDRLREWAEAQNGRAWSLVDDPDPRHRDAATAVALASGAVGIEPGRAAFWNTLGAAHYRAGDWALAIAALEKSAAAGPAAHDLFFLAMSHARNGDPRRARDYLSRGVARAARDAPGHAGLARLRAEATATVAGVPGPPPQSGG